MRMFFRKEVYDELNAVRPYHDGQYVDTVSDFSKLVTCGKTTNSRL